PQQKPLPVQKLQASHAPSDPPTEKPNPNAHRGLHHAKPVLHRKESLGKAYLSERGISLQTASAQGVEIDSSINRDRIVQRLGGDIEVEGTPVSKTASEIIWFPEQDATGETVSWTARILPTPEKGPKFLRRIGGNAAPFIPKSVYESRTKPTT